MSDPLSWLRAPCVMGILNATPDSLWGGSGALDPREAMARLARMADDGAAICDVGAESTRPGSDPVGAREQLARLDGVLRAVREEPPPLALSVDTSLAPVAEAALDAGAVMVNDVTAGRGDPDLLPLVAERGAAVCLVHMRGAPRTMQSDPRYDDVVGEVREHLAARLAAALEAGIPEEHVVLDPGLGFGKTLEHNLALLAGLPALVVPGAPGADRGLAQEHVRHAPGPRGGGADAGVDRRRPGGGRPGRGRAARARRPRDGRRRPRVGRRRGGRSVSEDRLSVAIHGLEAFGRHGVHPAETALGQTFVVDVELTLTHAVAAATDDLGDTVDYAALADAIVAIVEGPPFALLERLAGVIADRVLEEPGVRDVAVTVRKPHVALPHSVADTAVTLRRQR